MSEEILDIATITRIKDTIDNVLSHLKSFDLIDAELVPEGLKPLARSVSWIVEQVIAQNLRKHKSMNNLEQVLDPPHNLTQYDCILKYKDDPKKYYVNLKTSLIQTKNISRFDISKATKIVELYRQMPSIALIVAIIKIDMKNTSIIFKTSTVFNIAWTPDIYYNRANHNLQSRSDGTMKIRTNSEFIKLLKEAIEASGHTIHY